MLRSDRPRTWGFRCSMVDAVFLAATAPATWLLWPHFGVLAGVIPVVVGHFFLFCNIVRLHRQRELLWAGAFVVNVTAWALADALRWPWVLACQTPLTIALIIAELRGTWYHGVLAPRINVRLDEYLEGRL